MGSRNIPFRRDTSSITVQRNWYGKGMNGMDRDEGESKVQMKVRLDQSLRDYLESAANERGVSINREIVERLERSRQAGSTYDEVMGKETVAVTDIIGMVLRQVSELAARLEPISREQGWLHSPYAFDQAARGVCAALEAFRPVGDMPDLSAVSWMERVGENTASHVLELIAARKGSWERRIAARLGSLIDDAAAKLAPPATPAEDK